MTMQNVKIPIEARDVGTATVLGFEDFVPGQDRMFIRLSPGDLRDERAMNFSLTIESAETLAKDILQAIVDLRKHQAN